MNQTPYRTTASITASTSRLKPKHNGTTAVYEEPSGNRVYIENGEVKTDIITSAMSIEEAKRLTLKAIDFEYSLP